MFRFCFCGRQKWGGKGPRGLHFQVFLKKITFLRIILHLVLDEGSESGHNFIFQ
jgi:hypothetical protein